MDELEKKFLNFRLNCYLKQRYTDEIELHTLVNHFLIMICIKIYYCQVISYSIITVIIILNSICEHFSCAQRKYL